METQTINPPNIPLRHLRERRDEKVKQAAVQTRILREVAAERRRQDEIHPDSNCSLPHVRFGYKLSVGIEEVGEVGTEVAAYYDGSTPEERRAALLRMKTELIQVAATAVAWVESLEVLHDTV